MMGKDIFAHPWRLVDPSGFRNALWDFASNMDTLTSLWNRKVAQTGNTIAPGHRCPAVGAQGAPYFTLELQAMKWLGQK